jgi:hypothetical protein
MLGYRWTKSNRTTFLIMLPKHTYHYEDVNMTYKGITKPDQSLWSSKEIRGMAWTQCYVSSSPCLGNKIKHGFNIRAISLNNSSATWITLKNLNPGLYFEKACISLDGKELQSELNLPDLAESTIAAGNLQLGFLETPNHQQPSTTH